MIRTSLARSNCGVSVAVVAFHLATARIYGYHRDELYYLASGRRLAWGYVDQPPITPALYRLGDRLFGSSLLGLRVVPALAHGGIVVLTVLLARELGGNHRAQLIAAVGAALAPILLTTGHFLTTVTLEIVAWLAASLLVARLLNGADPRLWLAVGAVVGIGLLDKWTTAFVVAGLGLGLLLVPERRVLATPWVLGGAALALALWAPNLAWQAQHGWPQLKVSANLRDYGHAWLTAPLQFVILGAVSVLLALPGLLWLLRDPAAHPYRALGVAFLVIVVLVTATGGKAYYAAVFAPVLLAAGAVARGWPSGRALPVLLVITGVVAAPFALPLLPLRAAEVSRRFNAEIGEMVGWPELVSTVASVYRAHPGATVFTANYSEAAAIELLGPAHGLPQPISGHMTYWYWGHPSGRSALTIAVGFPNGYLDASFGRVVLATRFHSPAGAHNQEDGAPIWLCSDQRADWDVLWPKLQHFSTGRAQY